jgi:hypothetical protein
MGYEHFWLSWACIKAIIVESHAPPSNWRGGTVTEYFCDACAKKNDLPKKTRKVLKKCKYCGAEKLCNDDKPVKVFGKK